MGKRLQGHSCEKGTIRSPLRVCQGQPPPDRTWIAGVVRTPFSTAFRLDPAGLGVHGPITDHCSPLQFGPAPPGPAMPLAGGGGSPWAAGLSDQVWKAAQLL